MNHVGLDVANKITIKSRVLCAHVYSAQVEFDLHILVKLNFICIIRTPNSLIELKYIMCRVRAMRHSVCVRIDDNESKFTSFRLETILTFLFCTTNITIFLIFYFKFNNMYFRNNRFYSNIVFFCCYKHTAKCRTQRNSTTRPIAQIINRIKFNL